MAIEIACTLESNLLPTTIQTNQAIYLLVENIYVQIYKNSPISGAIFCSIECSSVLAETQIKQWRWSFLKSEKWKVILHRGLISWAIAYAVSNNVATTAYLSS